MPADVLYAPERCQFGSQLFDGVIKHSNLTAGQAAFCGGELVFLSSDEVVVNGRSGRYGPQSDAELKAAAEAFKASGYEVWTMGWDDDVDLPAPFLGKLADPV